MTELTKLYPMVQIKKNTWGLMNLTVPVFSC